MWHHTGSRGRRYAANCKARKCTHMQSLLVSLLVLKASLVLK